MTQPSRKYTKALILILTVCLLLYIAVPFKRDAEKQILLKDFNVLWITAESMKPEHLGAYGYRRATSPNIDVFSKTGTKFEWCTNPSAWTSENMVSNFTSLYSPTHGVETRERHVKEEWYLPLEKLRDLGYHIPYTQGFQQDTNFQFLGFEGGFDKQEPEAWLEKLKDSKFFIWIHLLQTHLPYDAPEPHRSLFYSDKLVPNEESRKRVEIVSKQVIIPRGTIAFKKEEDLAGIQALYDADVHYMDERFGMILSTLDRLNLRKKTIIIFSADHGEEQLEHGFVGHASTARGGTLYDEITHVPLIISLPGSIPQDHTVHTQVSGIDLIPTIFDLIGIPPEAYFSGKSLLPMINDRYAKEDRIAYSASSYRGYQEFDPNNVTDRMYSVRSRDWKLVRHTYASKPNDHQLYNLKNDPHELKDVRAAFPKQMESMAELLDDWLSKSKNLKISLESEGKASPLVSKSNNIDAAKEIEILSPTENAELSFESCQGEVILTWNGEKNTEYLVELEIGTGTQQIKTTLTNKGPELKRTFSESYWKEYVSRYNPVKFRVRVNSEGGNWSQWRTVRIS